MTTPQRKRKPPRSAWKPGQSGNPRGLPAGVREVRALALERGIEAVERLTQLMRQKKDSWLAHAAACALLDRAGAKPYQVEPDRLEVMHAAIDSRATLAALLTRRAMAIVVEGGAAGAAGQPQPAAGG